MTPCPCNSNRPYTQCCEPLHHGTPAPTAEALMRSRYSAYVFGLEGYLLASWHPSTRPEAMPSPSGVKWLRLKVLSHEVVDATHAQVAFEARFIDHGRSGRMRELSRFVLEGEHWFYVDGDVQ